MANNPEMAFLGTARRLGEVQADGLVLTREHEITHFFLACDDEVALRKALWEQGFQVSERQGTPGLEARRKELLSVGNLKEVVGKLCRTADKYAAQYDGWNVTARLNRSGDDH
ncbi:MAG TPA: ribonuclease E inhibitor RraB [Allosphingosinicella sp.]|nr:ribonuclease E inhibitor RraB [Allosphingosinicella sp.]